MAEIQGAAIGAASTGTPVDPGNVNTMIVSFTGKVAEGLMSGVFTSLLSDSDE